MSETFTNVWDALEDNPAERESLKVKSRLVIVRILRYFVPD